MKFINLDKVKLFVKVSAFALFLMFDSGATIAGVDEGFDAMETGDYETAIFHFEQELEKVESTQIHFLLGIAYFFSPEGIDNDYSQAFQHISQVAEAPKADVYDMTVLGSMYYFGQGVKQSDSFAKHWFDKAIEKKENETALWLLGKIYLNGDDALRDFVKAKEMFLRGDAVGDANSQFELGHLYEFGKGVVKDESKAVKYYLKAAEQGDADAQYRADVLTRDIEAKDRNANFEKGLDFAYGLTTKIDYEKSIIYYKKAAYEGHSTSLYNIGFMLDRYSPIKQSEEVANYYLQAAELGNIYAQIAIAFSYETGSGVELNAEESVYWSTQAALQGDMYSMKEVGGAFYSGFGVGKNYAKTFEWYQKASDLGDAEATFFLATMYEDGEGVAENFESAFQMYLLSAERGDADAQDELSDIYYKGVKVPLDYDQAYYWAEKAATQHHTAAQNKLGMLYETGRGVKLDMAEALYWYNKAADEDNIKALLNLARMYGLGEGVKRDLKASFDYSYKAAILGSPAGQYYVARMWKIEDMEEAMYWYEESAKNEYLDAQIDLGEIYFTGDNGIERDYEKSAHWFREAVRNFEANTTVRTGLRIVSSGTGFFVTPNHIVTNDHVIESCDEIMVKNLFYKSVVEVLDTDFNSDLSVLVTGKPNSSYLFLRGRKPVLTGERSIVIGYPFSATLGSGSKVTTGNISALTGFYNNIAHMQLTSPVQPGNSGGPLLDDNGNVIGVIVSRLERSDEITGDRPAQNVNFAIKVNLLKMFLDFNMVDYREKENTSPKDVSQILLEVKEATVQVICKSY